MYFLGWYVAEGYVSQGRYVRLSLGLHESVVAERLLRITADKFHAVTKQTEIRSNGGVSLRLEFCSSVIAQLLTKLVGNGARNKHLPTGYARLEP